MTSVVYLNTGGAHSERIQRALGAHGSLTVVEPTDDPDALVAMVADDPDVVVVGPDLGVDQQLAIATLLDFHRPDTSVVLIGEPTSEMFSRALTIGVRDIVSPSGSDADLVTAISRAADATRRRREHLGDAAPSERRARVITVLSPKGGSGKTTIATNLAVGLARQLPGRVVLVDLDIQFGGVAGALRLEPQHSLADATRLGDRLDITTLKVFLTSHASGLYVLCSPDSLIEADAVSGDQLKPVLSLLTEAFDYVVVDTAAGIGEYTLAALEMSSDFLLVCSTEVPSIRGIQRQVAAFDTVNLTDQRRTLVINRANARVGLSVADIEATLGMRVDVSIPSSRTVVIATNHGEPVLAGEERDPVRRSMEELVTLFAHGASAAEQPNARRFWKERA